MAKLSMVDSQAVAELAKLLYDFLPGTFSSITWPDVAGRFSLEGYWSGGSKLPAITQLLRNTLQFHRDRFCDLTSETMRIGRRQNLIAVSGHDLILILEQHWTLADALRIKLRHTGETGEVYLPLDKATM